MRSCGHRAAGANEQLAAFEQLCDLCQILPLDREALDSAADIYADLRQRAEPIGEVDVLIAGIAVAHGLGVVTRNAAHFQRVPHLHVVNWCSE